MRIKIIIALLSVFVFLGLQRPGIETWTGNRMISPDMQSHINKMFAEGSRPLYVEGVGTVWYKEVYEFKVWQRNLNSDTSLADHLNRQSKDGWEFVQYIRDKQRELMVYKKKKVVIE